MTQNRYYYECKGTKESETKQMNVLPRINKVTFPRFV